MDDSQTTVSPTGEIALVEPIYESIADELDRLGKSWRWLAKKIERTPQSVSNWKRKRVPPEVYPAVAKAFGWTVERLLSGSADDSPQPRLTPHALEIAMRLDAIEDHAKFRAAYMAMSDALDRSASPSSHAASPPAPPPKPGRVPRR